MSVLPKSNGYYTYADYETWDDDFRCELIDGVVYAMSAPSRFHQAISVELTTQLHTFLRGKSCKLFHAPFDVRLNAHTKDDIVVQPDLLVVCNELKIENGRHCIGAPDFVIEILSPSTSNKDRDIKSKRYLEAGVREYWLICPESLTVETLISNNGKYQRECYSFEDEIPVSILEGCILNMKETLTA